MSASTQAAEIRPNAEGPAPMIRSRGLARTFRTKKGPIEAVRGVDMTVHRGEIVGFLGPNGAGKSTTLRMLTTLLTPTAGDVQVAGHDLLADPVGVRRSIGYVAQGGMADPKCPVAEELHLQCRLHGYSPRAARERTQELLGRLELDGLAERPVGSLSGGQRRRLDIALGLAHEPDIVFLDEPTTGLDPQSRANLWDHIRSLRDDAGATVFLCTHYLDEVDALCDRILVMDRGSIVAEGTPAELKRRVSGDVIGIDVGAAGGEATSTEHREAALRHLSDPTTATRLHIDDVSATDQGVRMTTRDGESTVVPLITELGQAGVTIHSITVSRPSLDDVFLALTGRSLRDDSPTTSATDSTEG